MNFHSLHQKINRIATNQYYEGDFGNPINIGVLSELTNNIKELSYYSDFLKEFGYGELDPSFYIEELPVHSFEIFPNEKKHLKDLYIFATDQSELSYVCDISDFCRVKSVSACGEVSEIETDDFESFIEAKILEILEMVKWRNENL